jgi:hypothetical protein
MSRLQWHTRKMCARSACSHDGKSIDAHQPGLASMLAGRSLDRQSFTSALRHMPKAHRWPLSMLDVLEGSANSLRCCLLSAASWIVSTEGRTCTFSWTVSLRRGVTVLFERLHKRSTHCATPTHDTEASHHVHMCPGAAHILTCCT